MGRAARRLGEDADPGWLTGVHLPRNYVQSTLNAVHLSRSSFKSLEHEGRVSVQDRAKAPPNNRARAAPGEPATDGRSRSLWFNPPDDDPEDRRPQLTRQRIVTEALAVIAQDGAQALTMRSLAARLGVVPGALYHHLRNKQQLHDLVLDGVLAEVDVHPDPSLGWPEQLKVLAHRLRQVLERHPGIAGILKTRDRLGPHSLALAEAFLSPLQTAGFADHQAAWPSSSCSTAPSALPSAALVPRSTSSASATRRSEPSCTSSSAPCPPTASQPWSPSAKHVWVDNRDERFSAGLQVLVDGLQHARRSPHRPALGPRPTTTTRTSRGREDAQQAVAG
jgi:AcrR family transcriptional regulator